MLEHFERYYKAAEGDLPYIENLLRKNPALLNTPWDGHDATFFSEKLVDSLFSATEYAAVKQRDIIEKIGVKSQWTNSFVAVLVIVEILAISIMIEPAAGALLLASGLDVQLAENYAKTRKGWTLLQFAAEKGQTNVAEHLIAMGADINNNYLELAIENGHKNFVTICTQKEQILAQEKKIHAQKEQIEELFYAIEDLSNKNKPTHHRFFSQSVQLNAHPSQQLLTNQFYEYHDDEIRNLLKKYLGDNVNISPQLTPFIRQTNRRKHHDAEQNFRDAVQAAWQSNTTSVLLINPSREQVEEDHSVDGIHWISVVVEPQQNAVMTKLTLMDSLGDVFSKTHTDLIEIIRSALNHGENGIDISVKSYLLNQQKDDVDCGAWCVDNTVQLIKGKSFRHPHPEKYLNNPSIKDKMTGAELREAHRVILNEVQATLPQVKI